jgi:O-antigen/teichoic acid export membrane protein
MGAAGVLSNVFFVSQLPSKSSSSKKLTFNLVAADHWRYGRWAVASALAAWFPDNIYYALLPARTGLEGAAALRALINLINPAFHTLVALSGFLIPVLVKHARQGGLSKMTSTMKTSVVLLLPGTLIYFGVLLVARPFLFHTIYAGRYAQYSGWPLLLVGIIPVTTGMVVIFSTALRALEKPNTVFWCYLAAGLICVLVGLPLTVYEGVAGAAGGLVITSSVALISMAWAFHRCVAHAKATEQATCIPQPVLSD